MAIKLHDFTVLLAANPPICIQNTGRGPKNMCWSGEASTAMAVAGFGVTAYVAWKKEPAALWLTLGFFSSMELIQALSYPVIGQCGAPANKALSIASFVHVALQPFFFNLLALYFIPDDVRRRIQKTVYALCAVAAALTFWQMLPSETYGTCSEHRAMCGAQFCTLPGNWHLAWEFPFNGWGNGFAEHSNWFIRLFPNALVAYSLAVFVMPLIYGSWKMAIYQYVMGPVIVSQLTNNIDEAPAIWCLMSVGIAFLVVATPLRGAMRVNRWVFWRDQAT